MNMKNKILLRGLSVIETINDQLKNISQAEHSRHRSFGNFNTHLIASLIGYSFQEKKRVLSLKHKYNTIGSFLLNNQNYLLKILFQFIE